MPLPSLAPAWEGCCQFLLHSPRLLLNNNDHDLAPGLVQSSATPISADSLILSACSPSPWQRMLPVGRFYHLALCSHALFEGSGPSPAGLSAAAPPGPSLTVHTCLPLASTPPRATSSVLVLASPSEPLTSPAPCDSLSTPASPGTGSSSLLSLYAELHSTHLTLRSCRLQRRSKRVDL